MLTAEIPPDVWIAISDLIKHPQSHIALSQLCQTSRAVYDGDEKWKHLCRSIGIGRAIVEKELSWKRVFMEVVGHRKGCKVPTCYQFAVPPTNVVGDLLPSPQAVLEHVEYFKLHAPAKPHVCPFSPLPAEGDEDGDEGDEGNMDGGDGDDLNPSDPANPGHVPVDPAAALLGTVDPNAILASFFSMLGMPAPPAGALNPVPVPLAGGAGYLFPAVLGGAPPAAPVDPAADPAVPDLPAPPAVTPRLLPLSLKIKDSVPHKPTLHPFIVETGAVQFERFLAGKINLNPFPVLPTRGTITPIGIDWNVEDGGEGQDWVERCLVDIKDHPLLSRAFATNPPVTEMQFRIEHLSLRVVNKDGITIKDVIHNMGRYLSKPLSAKEKEVLCTCEPGPEACVLDAYKTRLGYLYRNFQFPKDEPEADAAKVDKKVPEIWLRGLASVRDGQVVCSMYP